jgi:hypothetical protein
MKLSTETLSVLKNFSAINSNIVINSGNRIKTMAEAKNVMASATVSEKFPDSFGVYDLGEFLSVYGMFDDPDLTFDNDMKYVVISEGRRSVKYFFSDTSILTTPGKDIKMPPVDVSLTLTADDINSIRRAASALGVSDVVITNEGGNLSVVVTDVKNSTSNTFEIGVEGESEIDEQFAFVFNVSNFKMIQGNYDVEISKKLISKFSNTNGDVDYFIALEKTSTIGE